MSIQGINTGYGGSSVPDAKTSSGTGMEEIGIENFLTLFIAQIQNQDPLSPLDSAEFSAQLAQFTSVEQLYVMNKSLSDIKVMLNDQGGQQDLIGLIGKTVKADDNTILIQDEEVISGSYRLEDEGNVTMNVYDSNGLKVRTLYLGPQNAGEQDFNWDGRDDAGEILGDGNYTFEVTARDENGNYVGANTYISGEVTGVTYKYGYPYLMVGERLISNDNIIEVNKTTT